MWCRERGGVGGEGCTLAVVVALVTRSLPLGIKRLSSLQSPP